MSTDQPPSTADRTDDQGSSPVLRTARLTKRFGSFTAVEDVDLEVAEGEIRSIIGPNGAGKTTLFNLFSGLVPVTEGTIEYRGVDITGASPAETTQLGLARSFQITNIFDRLSVAENLGVAVQRNHLEELSLAETYLQPVSELSAVNEQVDDILEKVGLYDVRERPATALSHGDKRRLELGLILAVSADVILLDEPTAGMASTEKRDAVEFVSETLSERTVLLVEHDVNLVMDLSDRITVLHQGRVIADGDPETIAADEGVRDAYLGGM